MNHDLQLVEIIGASRTGKTTTAKQLGEGMARLNHGSLHFINYVNNSTTLQNTLKQLDELDMEKGSTFVIDEVNEGMSDTDCEVFLGDWLTKYKDKIQNLIITGTSYENIFTIVDVLAINKIPFTVRMIRMDSTVYQLKRKK